MPARSRISRRYCAYGCITSYGTQDQWSHRRSSCGSSRDQIASASSTSRLLPIPGSPTSRSAEPTPSPSSSAERTRSSSRSRPTSEASSDHRAHAPGRGETPADAERRDGLALALHVDPPEVLDVEQVGDESVRVLGDLHRAGLGGLLHPRGDVHGVAHRRVLVPQVRADLPDDDRTGVDPDADVEIEPPFGPQPLLERRDRGDDLEPRHHGALRVVLMRGRSAEEREDRVAHRRATVPSWRTTGSIRSS